MKLSMQKNSEVTLFDSTYRVIVEGYSLYIFLAQDLNGSAQPVAMGFMVDDRKDTLSRFVPLFT